MAQRINKDNFEEKVLKSPLPVLVDFYSDSCIPCKQLSPVLGDIEDEREDTLSVYKVNVNYDMELAEKYDVMGVPALRLFVQGEVKAERAGAAGKADIEAWIDENLKQRADKKRFRGKEEKHADHSSRKQKEVKDDLKLTELFELEQVETPEYVTVSINEEFVPSEQVESTVLKDGDNVEFLYFMGGGSYGVNR